MFVWTETIVDTQGRIFFWKIAGVVAFFSILGCSPAGDDKLRDHHQWGNAPIFSFFHCLTMSLPRFPTGSEHPLPYGSKALSDGTETLPAVLKAISKAIPNGSEALLDRSEALSVERPISNDDIGKRGRIGIKGGYATTRRSQQAKERYGPTERKGNVREDTTQ